MKKQGFTLAEVLISLTIIGVIAALTTPTLITSSRNQANASKLSSTVANLENAFTSLIAFEGTDDITETTLWSYKGDADTFTGELGKYIKSISFDDGEANKLPSCYTGTTGVKNKSGTALTTVPNITKEFIEFTLPSGAAVFLAPDGTELTDAQKDTAAENGGVLVSAPAYLTIDVNGGDAPNRVGRDIFCFILGTDGKLYPFGGKDVAIFKNNGAAKDSWNSANAPYPCTDTTKSSGEGCTARLMEEGYKMKY